MMCSYVYDLALYKISNIQQSGQLVTGINLKLQKNCVQQSSYFTL